MWLVILLLLALPPVIAAEPAADLTAPCAHWDKRFPQRLTADTIPPALNRVLVAHKGHGFATTFAETKHVALLKRPLRSSGQLIFIPHQGLYRQLTAPFEQELLITPTALHQRQTSGISEVLSLEKLPAAKVFVDAFLAVFSGSWDTLHTHFHVFFATDQQQWQLGLKPTHDVMAERISCLVLAGHDERLVTLSVQETNGDFTVNRFRNPQLLPKTRWGTYRSQFEWSR